MKAALTSDQLYRLNDSLTAVLGELGWASESDEDDSKLNEAVFSIAAEFFPEETPEPEMTTWRAEVRYGDDLIRTYAVTAATREAAEISTLSHANRLLEIRCDREWIHGEDDEDDSWTTRPSGDTQE